jgi:hypothetical protein
MANFVPAEHMHLLLDALEAALQQVLTARLPCDQLSFRVRDQEEANQADPWMQLEEFHRSLARALHGPASSERSSALARACAADADRVTQIQTSLNALGEASPDIFMCLCELRPLEELLREVGVEQEPIAEEYDKDWSQASGPLHPDHEVRIEILGLSDLSAPDYRVGDKLQQIVRGPGSRLESVYVEVRLGTRTCKTQQQTADGTRSTSFNGEKMLFDCRRQSQLLLSVRDHRRAQPIQSMLRGHPLIGQASITLDDLPIEEASHKEVVIHRCNKPTGKVTLQVHLTPLPWSDKAEL